MSVATESAPVYFIAILLAVVNWSVLLNFNGNLKTFARRLCFKFNKKFGYLVAYHINHWWKEYAKVNILTSVCSRLGYIRILFYIYLEIVVHNNSLRLVQICIYMEIKLRQIFTVTINLLWSSKGSCRLLVFSSFFYFYCSNCSKFQVIHCCARFIAW